jgi:hypothetical protein
LKTDIENCETINDHLIEIAEEQLKKKKVQKVDKPNLKGNPKPKTKNPSGV